MALHVSQRCVDASPLSGARVMWPLDDYVFHMVLRQGRMINRVTGPCVVEAIDFSQSPDGRSLIFHMSPLEASTIAEAHPEFLGPGLIGRWKLSATNGLIKLVTVGPVSAEDARRFLCDSSSHELVRQRYEAILTGTV